LNCCRCHDHKYDPLSQKDFYSFFAFFNNLPESGTIQGASNRSGGNSAPVITVPDLAQEKKLAELRKSVSTAQAAVTEKQLQLPNLVADWEAEMEKPQGEKPPVWQVLPLTGVKSSGGASLTKLPDESWLAGGTNANGDTYTLTAPVT
jgi:hypothetical protein